MVTWLNDDEITTWVRLAALVELLPGALDSQLRRDSDLTHFEYFTLAMLSESPERVMRMTALAAATNATLPRLSHVVSRLEKRELVERHPCSEDRRATVVHLTPTGWDAVVAAAPGHVANVREHVLDALTPAQVRQLGEIAAAVLTRLDPQGAMTAPYRRVPPG